MAGFYTHFRLVTQQKLSHSTCSRGGTARKVLCSFGTWDFWWLQDILNRHAGRPPAEGGHIFVRREETESTGLPCEWESKRYIPESAWFSGWFLQPRRAAYLVALYKAHDLQKARSKDQKIFTGSIVQPG
jgi:hypothetical protein